MKLALASILGAALVVGMYAGVVEQHVDDSPVRLSRALDNPSTSYGVIRY